MADSISAVIQLAERVANVCKWLIETVQDYPRDLRLIFVETGSLKVIFESLRFLKEDDPGDSATLRRLRGSNGPVEGCKAAMNQLDQLFPLLPSPSSNRKGTKRQKIQTTLTRLAWPLNADRARKLLDEIMCHKSTINVALQGQLLTEFRNMRHQLDEVHITLDASEKRKVYEWCQDTNPSSFHNAAKGLYEDNTGDWVFRTSHWDDWIHIRMRALWIYGIPGAGKTILAAHIIEKTLSICEANDKRTTCVYYYCYHGHNQDESVPFLRWLVSQLLREADVVPTIAWKAYMKSMEPDKTLLLDVLHAILNSFDLVYVAIDAIDESQSRQNLLSVLNALVTDPRFLKIQLLATSREYSDIELEMSLFSQSLSMSNCYVEADIGIYVAAKITAEAKFKRWPSDLRTEVEATLSTGAKGMFRWAVCQLDILRRLHHQSKIREAIKSLPKDMDETYERIFSYIADEEKEIVRHTLYWVCFHDFFWKGSVPLPAKILIDAYVALSKGRPSSDDSLHDLETLRDSCGCLVSFTLNTEDQSHLANIAHYTVREFLESDRSSSTSWFSIKRNDSYRLILDFVLEYAITSEPIENPEDWDEGSPLDLGSFSSLQEYCIASSVRSLREHEELVNPGLAFRFLDPLKDHFDAIHEALYISESSDGTEILFSKYPITNFWDVEWDGSTQNSKTAILAHLLLMECYSLATSFIQDLDIMNVLQETLFGLIGLNLSWREYPNEGKFACNLVELLAEIREFDGKMLDFFQREAHGLVCYTEFLPYYMPGHLHDIECDGTCVLLQLLQLGANPDPKGFQVTPLQIAVFSRDIAGVRTLLEAGADANNIGNKRGIEWHAETSALGPYACLHGLTPLYILRHLKAHPSYEDVMTEEEISLMNGEVTIGIERLLLDHNASTMSMENRESGKYESDARDPSRLLGLDYNM